MNKILVLSILSLFCGDMIPCEAQAQIKQAGHERLLQNVPLDSITLSDPFVLADRATKTYYMTGTGGKLWKSKNLSKWNGPYDVVKIDTMSWMGVHPQIWAAEIHRFNNRYYYIATFTNSDIVIDTVAGNIIPRRATHILVSDKPDGPYLPVSDELYLPADKATLDGTLWVDKDRKPYLVYCHEWLQTRNGTIEKMRLKPDLSGTEGTSKILFSASEAPWSRENTVDGSVRPNSVTDGPFLFRTTDGTLGMIWSSWIRDVYTQGVAYSQSGTLDGPWIQEPNPITPPNYGHGMIFRTFDGRLLMAVHSHKQEGAHRVIRHPHFFTAGLKGNRLTIGVEYRP